MATKALFRISPRLLIHIAIVALTSVPSHAREVLATNIGHVVMELSHRTVDLFEMADLESSNGLNSRGLGCVDVIVHTPVESLMLGQRGGGLASIPDLPSVPTSSLILILSKVVLCKIHDFIRINFHGGTLAPLELFEICCPDFHRLVALKRWVVELSVDPRHESLV